MTPETLLAPLPPELRHLLLTMLAPPPAGAQIVFTVEPCEFGWQQWWVSVGRTTLTTIHPPEEETAGLLDLSNLKEVASGSYVQDDLAEARALCLSASLSIASLIEMCERIRTDGLNRIGHAAYEMEMMFGRDLCVRLAEVGHAK